MANVTRALIKVFISMKKPIYWIKKKKPCQAILIVFKNSFFRGRSGSNKKKWPGYITCTSKFHKRDFYYYNLFSTNKIIGGWGMRRVQWGHLAREDSCCIVFWVGEVGQLWVSCKPHLTTETTATQNTVSQTYGTWWANLGRGGGTIAERKCAQIYIYNNYENCLVKIKATVHLNPVKFKLCC